MPTALSIQHWSTSSGFFRMYLTALAEGCKGYSYHTLQALINDSHVTPKLALCAIHTMNRVAAARPILIVDVDFGPDADGVDLFIEAPDGLYVPLPARTIADAKGQARFTVDLTGSIDATAAMASATMPPSHIAATACRLVNDGSR